MKSLKIFAQSEYAGSEKHLLNVFSFPPDIKHACEQYLIYFSKFLQDLGIDAQSKLGSQSKSTFFTVTPTDSQEALSKIKILLDIYLNLPEASNLSQISINYSDASVP